MGKFRIVLFADILEENKDGASRTIFQIVKNIPADEFEFLFVCGVAPHETLPYEIFVVPSFNLPFNHHYQMALPFLTKSKLNEKLKQFGPQVVHITTPSPLGHFAVDYANTHGLPIISIYHTHFISYVDYYFENIPFLIGHVKQFIAQKIKKFYNRCDVLYVPTTVMTEALTEIGISKNIMKIWPRGIYDERFGLQKRDTALVQNMVKNDSVNILFASRLVWEKNLKTLVNIYRLIQERELPYNIIIAGDGVAGKELKKMMPKAYFLGNVSQEVLAVWYASCDIFLFTSITETYGNVVAEAMASGLPCIIANGGGSASFIDHGQNGFLCKPDDAEDYLHYIEVLAQDAGLKNKFIKSGLEETAYRSWPNLLEIYFQELKSLIKQGVLFNQVG